MQASIRIGELATRLGLPVQTIRYYEREGLLPTPSRTAGNYRLYDQGTVERLTFVRNCRALDMSLEEVRAFLRARDTPEQGCGGINDLVDQHIASIDARIDELQRLKQTLATLRHRCGASRKAKDCGILTELTHDHDPHCPC